MKRIPNILSGLRLCGAGLLLFATPFGGWFYALYLFCGLSDVLDGWLARRWNAASRFGAVLDSMADFVFAAVCLIVVLPGISLPAGYLRWIGGIAAVKLLALAAGWLRFRRPAFWHTWRNKAMGFLLFAFVPLLRWTDARRALWIVCAAASAAALEELALSLTARTLHPDRKGLFLPE